MIAVGRHINGITLNPLEWLENEDGSLATFPDEETAKDCLREQGYTDDDIYWMVFEEVEE